MSLLSPLEGISTRPESNFKCCYSESYYQSLRHIRGSAKIIVNNVFTANFKMA